MSNGLDTIMLPVRGDGKGDNVFAHGAALAHRFTARVRVVHCHPKADDLMPYGVVIPQVLRKQIEDAASNNADVTRKQLLEEFRALAKTLDLTEGAYAPDRATTRFIEYEGKQADAVRSYGRLADLICVPQPDKDAGLGFNTLKSALFSSGRPVMICPETEALDTTFADHVTIAWNGSLEATRAVAMTLPVISAASSVTILSSAPRDHTAPAEDLRRYLEIKGVDSALRMFDARSSVVGQQLLDETREAGADLMIMGAYHDSYERETIFGGNSQSVVEGATLPVIMVH